MRKLIYYMTVSLDGYFSGPNGELEYFQPSDEEHQYANDLERGADALLLGRRMYELMSYWDGVDLEDESTPPVQREFAAIYQAKPRYVFSRTLDAVDEKAVLLKEGILEEVARLKQEDGAYLGLGCGPQLLALFLAKGLVDEIRLMVMPLILGEGVPLFRDMNQKLALQLTSSRVFKSGCILLHYDVP